MNFMMSSLKTFCLILILGLSTIAHASDGLFTGITTPEERQKFYNPTHSFNVTQTEVKEMNVSTKVSSYAIAAAKAKGSSKISDNSPYSLGISGKGKASSSSAAGSQAEVNINHVLTAYKVDIRYSGDKDIGDTLLFSSNLLAKDFMSDTEVIREANVALGLDGKPEELCHYTRQNGPLCISTIPPYSTHEIERNKCLMEKAACCLGLMVCSSVAECICIRPFIGCDSIQTWYGNKLSGRYDIAVQAAYPIAAKYDARTVANLVKDVDERVSRRIATKEEERRELLLAMRQPQLMQ